MIHLLDQIYSWPCLIGAVLGLILQRLWRYAEAEYGNRHHPLPDGRKYYAAGLNMVWVAALVGFLTVGYVLLAATKAQSDTVALRDRLTSCQAEFQDALTLRANIAAQDSDLGNQISDLRVQQDDAMAQMMDRILNPPPDIAKLDVNNPRRLAWKTDVQIVWQDWTGKIRTHITGLTDQRKALAAQRAAHPIPELHC